MSADDRVPKNIAKPNNSKAMLELIGRQDYVRKSQENPSRSEWIFVRKIAGIVICILSRSGEFSAKRL
jgi:preprotein translocase subunit Sss1